MSITVNVDGKEVEVSFAGRSIFYGHSKVGTYSRTVEYGHDWKFGDILQWKDDPASEPLMFLCDDDAPELSCIWVIALTDNLIDVKARSLFERVEKAG